MKHLQMTNIGVQFVVCLMLNGTSALFRLLVPIIIEIKQMRHVKNELKQKESLKRNDMKFNTQEK